MVHDGVHVPFDPMPLGFHRSALRVGFSVEEVNGQYCENREKDVA